MGNKTSEPNSRSAEIDMIMNKFQADMSSDRMGEILKILDDEAVFEAYDNDVINELCKRQSKGIDDNKYFVK